MMDGYTNKKIYINPNFNRNTSVLPPPLVSEYSNKIYINRYHPNVNSSIGKIYINPKFIPATTNIERNMLLLAPKQESVTPLSDCIHKSKYSLVKTSTFTNANKQLAELNKEKNITEINKNLISHSKEIPLEKSQYCTVRKLKHSPIDSLDTRQYSNTKLTHTSPPVNASLNRLNTEKVIKIKINKYKSVPLSDLTKKLNSVTNTSSLTFSKNRFKYTKPNLTLPLPTLINKVAVKPVKKLNISIKNKKICHSNGNSKILKSNFKINNIPCRLFTKFGKCLRLSYGKCNYLHDKKYVSLCRKFLKGLCQDKDCPLSHDVSANKMPTCYFYLKGVCNKDNCPYLHIKLSDKAKICQDFLKGYCESGDMCTFRHVTKDKPKKFSSNKKLKKSPSTTIMNKQLKIMESPVNNDDKPQDEERGIECRYYEEAVNSEVIECIKPSRCKLGTLPSFIQI